MEYGRDANKTTVHVYTFEGTDAQRMAISKTTTGYKMRPECSTSRLINPYGTTVKSGQDINLYDDLNDSTQWWQFQKVTGGYVIRNVQNASCVLDGTNGKATVQTYSGSQAQIWVMEPYSHTHTYTAKVVAPTCTEKGYTVYNCSCGNSYTGAEKAATGHNYANGICTKCGAAVPVIATGTCGDNLTWKLGEDGLLTISGTGEMANYNAPYGGPWHNYRASIRNVIIESGVTSIGSYAFYECSSLTKVTIPSSVTSIGSDAFRRTGLTKVTIPSSVTSIGERVFFDCTGMTAITVSKENVNYTDVDGVLFNKTCTQLNCYPAGKTGTAYTIPSSVTSIGNWAFYNCTNLTKVTIPFGVTSIGRCAFAECAGLTGIIIPSSVTSIDYLAFYYCTSLTYVTIPSSVTSISQAMFGHCYSLTEVTIPSSVTSISNSAFSYCSKLTSVEIPAGVTDIGKEAFRGCTNLTDVYYYGTQVQWNRISIGTYNESLLNATIHCRECFNHSFANYVYNNDATCTADGTETAKCENCDVMDTRTVVDSALGHSFTSYISNGNATCTKDGTKTSKCDRCDAKKTIADTGSKLVHRYLDVVTAPTCTEKGYTTHTCSACGDTYTDTETAALGHSFTSYIPNSNATVEADGTKTAVCDYGCGTTHTVPDEGSRIIPNEPVGEVKPVPTTVDELIRQMVESSIGSRPANAEIRQILEDIREVAPGSLVSIEARAKKTEEDKLPADEAIKLKQYSNGSARKIASYLDLCVAVLVNGEKVGEVKEIDQSIQFAIAIPLELQSPSRKYTVLRIHNGVVEELPAVMRDGKLYFDTDRFSTYALAYEDIPELKFHKVSVTLQSDMQINYKVEKTTLDAFEDPYVIFARGTAWEKVTEYTEDGIYYVFHFCHVAPDRMGEDVTATLYGTYNGVVQEGVSKVFSVSNYCYTVLNDSRYNSNEKLRTLLVDLLNYGAQAQIYNKRKTEPVNKDLTEEQRGWATADRELTSVKNSKYEMLEGAVATWKSMSLVLNDRVSVRLKLQAEDIQGMSVRFTDDSGRQATVDTFSAVSGQENMYYVYLNDLSAGQMSDCIYAVVMKNGEAVSNTFRFSIESYASETKDIDTGNLGQTVKAMMRYGDAARNYKR